MKVVRLPSGPLACVYSLDEEPQEREYHAPGSGTFRAHSGSLQAVGLSEDEALAELDEEVRRVSVPPPEEPIPAPEPTRRASDQPSWPPRIRKCGQQDSTRPSDAETPFDGVTVPAPSSR